MVLQRTFPVLLAASLLASACASTPKPETSATAPMADSSEASVYDPLEGVNRAVFGFNEVVDKVVIGPVARGYGYIPYPIRDRIRDFARNLASPLVFIHDLAQGDGDRALVTFERFLVNTSMGGLGLVDIASQTGLTYHSEDAGQTLGRYGVGSGPYLVLPILGPSNARDTIGKVVDWFIDPVPYALEDTDLQDVPFGSKVALGIDTRQRYDKAIRDLRANSIDFYAATRDLYEQTRRRAIANGDDAASGAGAVDIPDYDAASPN